MRKFYYFIMIAISGLTFSCDGIYSLDEPVQNSKSNSDPIRVDTIVNILDIANKSLVDVEALLGKAERKENVKGYPCENIKCIRAFFDKGRYEILFKENLSNRITINKVSDFLLNRDVISSLGLPKVSPSFKRDNNIIRWNSINGIKEIQFNGNGSKYVSWIYVIVN